MSLEDHFVYDKMKIPIIQSANHCKIQVIKGITSSLYSLLAIYYIDVVTEISDWSDLETQLQETRESLEEIEQRLHQVRRDLHEKHELQAQQEQIRSQIQEIAGDRPRRNKNSKIRRKPNSSTGKSPANPLQESLQQQLQQISDRLEQIEADLESRLISWSSLHESFWQIVRFVGIGIIIGVILRGCAG
jgi:predicted nuclease with TOPRIM domain